MILTVVALVIIDQSTKWCAVATLGAGADIQLWPNVFHLHYISNYGAAWGILSGKQGFLIILTSLITIGMMIYLWQLRKIKGQTGEKVALILILSGAIGNLIDRIFLGYVRDFFYFALIDFPVFNVADMFVVIGVGLWMIILLFGDADKLKNKKEKRSVS